MAKPASPLSAFAPKESTKKSAHLTLEDPDLHERILAFAQAKAAADGAEKALKELRPELRIAALELYANYNVSSDTFAGNVSATSPHADLRLNINNGYKFSPSSEAIRDVEKALGKRLKHLFISSTTGTINFEAIPADKRTAFEEELTELFQKYGATAAMTVNTANVVVPEFNQKVARVLTADEIMVLDETLPVPVTISVTRLDSDETIRAAKLAAKGTK